MNRTIKFRAWDIEKKAWKGLWIFRGGHSGEYDVSNTEIDILDLTNKWGSNVKLMQFTGLLDCEGREIYESDIVEATLNYPEYTICKIVFKGMGFWFEDIEGELGIYHPETYKLTVIGNLYEHPNLLNNES